MVFVKLDTSNKKQLIHWLVIHISEVNSVFRSWVYGNSSRSSYVTHERAFCLVSQDYDQHFFIDK